MARTINFQKNSYFYFKIFATFNEGFEKNKKSSEVFYTVNFITYVASQSFRNKISFSQNLRFYKLKKKFYIQA